MIKQNQVKPSMTLRVMSTVTALSFSFASFQAMSLGADDEMFLSPLAKEFKTLDSNHDTKLSRQESKRDKDINLNFAKADADSDGILSMAEYENFKSALQQKNVSLYIDDATVTAKIKTELLKDAGFKGLYISVQTLKGNVILSGFVDTQAQANRAIAIASGVSGVQAVTNGLVVKA